MPIAPPIHALTKQNLAHAPDGPGVYALYLHDGELQLIFYGGSLHSVRDRLRNHQSGNCDPCTKQATHFACEATPVEQVLARHAGLMFDHHRENGRLPQCNDVTNWPEWFALDRDSFGR